MGRGREIAATLLIAFGLFSLLSLHTTATGQLGNALSEHMRTLMGGPATGAAVIIVWLGIILFRRPWDLRVLRRVAGLLLLLSVITIGFHLFGSWPDWPAVWSPREALLEGAASPGGMLGAGAAAFLMKSLGILGTGLSALALMVVSWILIVDNPLQQIGDAVHSLVANVQRRARDFVAGLSRPKKRPPRRARTDAREEAATEEPDPPKVSTMGGDETATAEETRNSRGRRRPLGRARRGRRNETRARSENGRYELPDASLLQRPAPARRRRAADDDQAQQLEETLASFGVDGRVVSISRGPTVTRYEVQPPAGIKVSRIVNLADDIALNLAATGVRVEAPVPGKSVVGIEVPNKETSLVVLREIVESEEFESADSKLSIALGRDIAGNPLVADLGKLLHLLIAGATGSGKSVCLNSIITSLLYKARPDEVKLMMIDPKRVELSAYEGVPHLIAPVVTDPRQAAGALKWAVKEMERRYELLSAAGARNIDGYNRSRRKPEDGDEFIPYLVIIIDELADLMLVASGDVEDSICRLAQMARAAGIYLVIATQRPSVDVITGLIKANVPSRMAFAVSSQVDSRTILDMGGAERLLGKGDMLFHPIGLPKPVRAQGAWVSDEEVDEVVAAWRAQAEPEYIDEVLETPAVEAPDPAEADDELFDDAVALVREMGHASVSMLQRRFRIGYARAARLIDVMEVRGIVGPYQGSKPREVIGIDGGIQR